MKTVRTPDATWLALRQKTNFQPFFEGLIEHLKKNLQQITVAVVGVVLNLAVWFGGRC